MGLTISEEQERAYRSNEADDILALGAEIDALLAGGGDLS